MAMFRNVNTTFWTDSKVVDDYTPEDKYFMLYCLTNPFTNLCGCYEITIKQIANDLGYDKATVEKLLDRFKSTHQTIDYDFDNKELFIINWNKYNWNTSPKLDSPLLKEITKIKTNIFYNAIAEIYNTRESVDNEIPYRYPIENRRYPIDTTITITSTNTISNSITNNSDDTYKDEFNTIWEYYPRKQGKKESLKNYIKARKKGTTREQVENGLLNYNKYIKVEKVEEQYIKKGSSWFNQECWQDDYTIKRKLTTKDVEIDISDF